MSALESETQSSTSTNGRDGSAPRAGKKPPMSTSKKQTLKWLAIAGGVLVVIACVLLYLHAIKYESTDDAFIDGHIVPISAKVAGQVQSMTITDNQEVKQGEVLIQIDPRDYQTAVDEQSAKADGALADARRASADAKRYAEIYKNDEISKQQLDNADASAASTQATYEKEKAALDQDKLNLSYTKIIAPMNGRVTSRSVEPGAYVQVGQTLFSLVPDQVWVTANFKETQLTHMQTGQKVDIHVDSFPSRHFDGHVDSIQSGTGERFSVMPPENATGNYVKVVQRVPVKILIDTPPDTNFRLAPGMSVEPNVKVQ